MRVSGSYRSREWGLGQREIQGGEEGLARLPAAGGKFRGRQQPGKRWRLSEGWTEMAHRLGEAQAGSGGPTGLVPWASLAASLLLTDSPFKKHPSYTCCLFKL